MSIVQTPQQIALWREAQLSGEEHAPSRFWNYYLTRVFFDGPNWVVSGQQPPTDSSGRRRVDYLVELITPEGTIMRLCYVESKAKSTAPGVAEEVEGQAYQASQDYIINHGVPVMYSITTIGTKARCWYTTAKAMYLNPMFGNYDLSAVDSYVEAHSTDGFLIANSIERMKRLGPPRNPSSSIARVINVSSQAQSSSAQGNSGRSEVESESENASIVTVLQRNVDWDTNEAFLSYEFQGEIFWDWENSNTWVPQLDRHERPIWYNAAKDLWAYPSRQGG